MPVSAAREVFSKYVRELPVDPKLVAERMGIKVQSRTSVFGGEKCSGSAYIEDDGRKVITYESLDHPVRQSFTIAHELGHHVLGHTRGGKRFRDTPKEFRMDSAPEEVAANKFAAELLMPEDAVRVAIYNKGITSLTDLARAFSVSEVAMKVRLKSLGIIHVR